MSRPDERVAFGKRARVETPLASHGDFERQHDIDPLALLEEQASTRIPELVPIRHGRMLASPFSYFRGAALPMASDLAVTPATGMSVQLCGDAHLSNFGFFGSPERHLVFDVNDFDETAPGPWEWDVKRLAASLEVAGRDNGFDKQERARIVRRSARAYRETMREFARMPTLEVWYADLDVDALLPQFRALLKPTKTPSVWKAIEKARAHDSLQAFEKLTHVVDGETRIVSDPPLILPVEELMPGMEQDAALHALRAIIHSYRHTLRPDLRQLLDHYRFAHLARKVVGVGSVGTDAWIVLLIDHAHGAPVFLQIKQAEASVLERFTSKSKHSNHGERVVAGQRLMQAVSDIFLGWERFTWETSRRDYYFRQLRDWKGSADIEGMTCSGMNLWARMCGWSLARSHARSGDRIAIASYLGKSQTFDRAIAEFAAAYADQNERDYDALRRAVSDGRLVATTGL